MTQGPEARFKQKVNSSLPAYVHHQGMSLQFSSGTPDVYYEGNKNVLWVEYKFLTNIPKNIDLHKLLSSLQQQWLIRASNNGVNTAVIVGLPKAEGVVFPALLWQKTLTKTEFLERKIHIKEISAWIVDEVCFNEDRAVDNLTS